MGKIINLSPKINLHLSRVFKISKYQLVFIPLLGLLLFCAWLRPVWYDDAGHYLVIRQGLETGDFCHPTDLALSNCSVDSPFITLGAPLNHAHALWMTCFGEGMGTARILTIFFTFLGFWALFELVRFSFSVQKAFWTLLLLMGNIQVLTYGSQVLGELPMLAGLLAGVCCFFRWRQSGSWLWGILAILAWIWAVFCKAYIALPIAFALGTWLLISVLRRDPKVKGTFIISLLWGLGLMAGLIFEQGGWTGFQGFLQDRGSYSNEFFTFDFVEALRFLGLKPLFWLGTLACLVRIYFQRRAEDIFLGCIQLGLFLFFICSAGYDRFGFQLLFIPAIFLSEFCLSLWKRWQGKWALKGAFILGFILLFVQQTPLIMLKDWPGRLVIEENWRGKWDPSGENGMNSIFTYDQHYALMARRNFRLPVVVPSNKLNCEKLSLRSGEWLAAGPYAFTEYQNCIPWDRLELVYKIEDERYPVSFYRSL